MSDTKRVYIRTFGCQMNVYDTGKMRALLEQGGYEHTTDMQQADLVIANTCSIREKAEVKLHSFLGEARRLKRERRSQPLTLAVAGCVAQQEGQTLLDRYADLDLVFGPDAVSSVTKLVTQADAGGQVLDTAFLDSTDYVFTNELDPAATDSITAFVTIQKGCDNKCTFCIVPSTRGVEVSRPSTEIIDEIKRLVDKGIKEITLIGQNVNSYGLKVPGELNFSQLLYAVSDVDGVERIRYTTSHPRDMGDDVVQAYRDLPKLTSFLHLPVQSGSNAVLRRMKRFYTREVYLEVVSKLRDARPDIVLSSDFIVGFPGETDEDFEQTMSLLSEVRFQSSYSFKYSQRPGTPALRLVDRTPVDPAVAGARLTRLQHLQRQIGVEEHRRLEGQSFDVLVEGPSRHDKGVVCGRTSAYKMVNFPGNLDLVGKTVPVTITRGFANTLRGERLYRAQ